MRSRASQPRRRLVRAIALTAIAVSSIATLAACTASGSSGSGSAGGGGKASTTLTIAATAGPASLDPTTSSNGVPQVWFPNLAYAALIERQPNGTAAPGLATTWKYSADRMSFVMDLRSGVKFSDGSPMTAQDVVNWLQHYKKSGSFTAWLANVSTITVTGPLQVTLKLSKLDPLLPYGLDQDGMAGDVVGPTGLANPTSLGSSTNGAGPYMLDKANTIANNKYVYVKNPYYWDKSAQHYDQVVVKIITDGNSVLAAMRSGQVQVAEGAATTAPAAKSAGLNIETAPSAMLGVYLADIEGKVTPALKDVRVRQALNYAVNRPAIVKSLYGEYGTPTAQFVPKGVGGYVASLDDQYPYDPAKAKQLLAQAGYPNGFSFTLVEQPAVDSGDLLAQALAANWKSIGVNVTIKTTPSFSAYVTLLLSKKYPTTTLTFQYSVQLVDTQQLVTNPALYNYMGFQDLAGNKLAQDQRAFDIQSPQGVQAAEASEAFMVKNAYLVPVASTDALLFSTKDVAGLTFGTYPWPDPTQWKPAA
jgi:peptide/nickel transport system substrate-binding protein